MSDEFPNQGVENDTLDFDQFWTEKKEKEDAAGAEKVKILGEWLVIPTDVPLAIEQMAQQTQIGNASGTKKLLEALYGEGIYDRWVDRGLTLVQLTIIMAWSLARIQGQKMSFSDVAEKMKEVVATGKVQALFGNIGPQSNQGSSPLTNSVEVKS